MASYNQFGEPLWINARIALARLGYDPPDKIGPHSANQILDDMWLQYAPQQFGENAPTWDELVEAERLVLLDDAKERRIKRLRRVTSDRITAAYGAVDRDDELNIRLRLAHTLAQDEERERIVAKYKEIRDMINGKKTESGIHEIDFDSEDLWTAP